MSRITATQWIWRDGSFIPWADAQVHVLSHSMQFGSAVFEDGTRVDRYGQISRPATTTVAAAPD